LAKVHKLGVSGYNVRLCSAKWFRGRGWVDLLNTAFAT